MLLPDHKTKIVATIGPASESPEMLERLIRAGLNVARLNFSHGDFTGHAERIARIRAAEQATGRRVAIMADLPGPKMRIGKIDPEPIQLQPGESFTLTSDDIVGDRQRVSVSFERLPKVVKSGDRLFLTKPLGMGPLTVAYRKKAISEELMGRAVAQMATLNKAAAEAMCAVGIPAAVHAARWRIRPSKSADLS